MLQVPEASKKTPTDRGSIKTCTQTLQFSCMARTPSHTWKTKPKYTSADTSSLIYCRPWAPVTLNLKVGCRAWSIGTRRSSPSLSRLASKTTWGVRHALWVARLTLGRNHLQVLRWFFDLGDYQAPKIRTRCYPVTFLCFEYSPGELVSDLFQFGTQIWRFCNNQFETAIPKTKPSQIEQLWARCASNNF